MKVGYLRFSGRIELDFMSSSVKSRGTEVRLGVIEAMVEQGIDVELLSPVKQEDEDFLEGNQTMSLTSFTDDDGSVDYDFLQRVSYEPKKLDLSDIDVLFIESGPTNVRYVYSRHIPDSYDWDHVPFIWRAFDVIDRFEGHVVYFQHDIKLGFPFSTMYHDVTEGVAQSNITRMANRVDFFEDKDWTILSNCLDPQPVIDHYSERGRYQYDQHPLTWEIIPSAYSSNIDQRFEQRESHQHELMYVGAGNRSDHRDEKIFEYYGEPGIDSGIVGADWDEIRGEDMTYHGKVGKHGDAYRIQNWGMASIVVGCRQFERSSMIGSRIAVTLVGGNIVMMDEDLGDGYYIDEEWHVSSVEDVRENIEYLRELDVQERRDINERQLARLNRWIEYDWKDVLSHTDERTIHRI